MSSVSTVEDQIRESRRIRIWGEISPEIISLISERTQDISPPNSMSEQQLKGTITLDIPPIKWKLIPPKDPFSLSFRDFIDLKPDEFEDLLKRVYNSRKDMLKEAWASGLRQVVICSGKIVDKTEDIDGISDEKVRQLAMEHDKACYVFSAPDVVEESVWTSISGDDFYPTLNVYLGAEDADEREIVDKSSPICADLDTGNPFYKVFDADHLSAPLAVFTPLHIRIAEHLGQSYTYCHKRLKMCVKDINGNINSTVCSVRVVKDWEKCALLQVSPNRKGFIGRDVLRDLRIRIKLDPIKKTTQILDVSS